MRQPSLQCLEPVGFPQVVKRAAAVTQPCQYLAQFRLLERGKSQLRHPLPQAAHARQEKTGRRVVRRQYAVQSPCCRRGQRASDLLLVGKGRRRFLQQQVLEANALPRRDTLRFRVEDDLNSGAELIRPTPVTQAGGRLPYPCTV